MSGPEVLQEKKCAKCGSMKPLVAFYRQRGGPQGRHSYCKDCYDKRPRSKRKTEDRRKNNYWSKYRMRPEQVNALFASQNGECAACAKKLDKFCIDHCHATGLVRGLLCHRCNLGVGFIETHPDALNLLGYVAHFNASFRASLEQEAEKSGYSA